MKKLSVIVPIYNVEQYLKKCLNSIVNQTYKDLEIILVDDGSPDGCPQLCDEYASLDNRIKVIHKKNGGLSSARNAGLDIATGDYVTFVDSDDYLETDIYEKVINIFEDHSADIVSMRTQLVDQKYNVIKSDVVEESMVGIHSARWYF